MNYRLIRDPTIQVNSSGIVLVPFISAATSLSPPDLPFICFFRLLLHTKAPSKRAKHPSHTLLQPLPFQLDLYTFSSLRVILEPSTNLKQFTDGNNTRTSHHVRLYQKLLHLHVLHRSRNAFLQDFDRWKSRACLPKGPS